MFICGECGEGLATYKDSAEKNCENPRCESWGIDQTDALYLSEEDLLERGMK